MDGGAEAPIVWPPDATPNSLEKTLMLGRLRAGEGQEKEDEDEMVGGHHPINGHEYEQTLRDSEGQGSLACCSSWGCSVRHKLVTEKQQQHRCVSVYT